MSNTSSGISADVNIFEIPLVFSISITIGFHVITALLDLFEIKIGPISESEVFITFTSLSFSPFFSKALASR